MKLTLRLFLSCCATVLLFWGQLPAQVQTPTVSAAALSYGQYADIPVNHHTGTGSVTVPLHTVTDGPLSLPVFLQYHTAGLLVNSPSSDVGFGWNLNAGGMISRSIKGIHDDKYPEGYYWSGDEIRFPGSNQSHASWGKDSEPDLFTYNFPGGSGKFFIDANREVQMVPRSDTKIEYSINAGVIDRFVATVPDGTKYYFGRTRSWHGYEATAKDYVSLNDPNVDVYTENSGWFLLMIKSADDKHQIKLSYNTVRYSYTTHKPCPEEFKFRKTNGNIETRNYGCNSQGIYQTYFVHSTVLNTIESTHETINVNTANRNDLGNIDPTYPAKAVTGIEVTNGDFCIEYEFDQSYFHNNYSDTKLKLDKVTKRSCNNAVSEPAWEFDYMGASANNGKKFFPATNNHDIDHWGYYNYDSSVGANDPNGDLTPPTGMVIGGQFTPYGTANRETNEAAMKTGMLEKVTYPTGGYLKMEYEANRYQEPTQEVNVFSIATCPSSNCSGTNVSQSNFTYSSSIANSTNPYWELCVDADPNSPTYSGEGKVEVFTLSNTLIAEFSFNAGPGSSNCLNGSLPTVGYASSNQPMQVGQTYKIKVTSINAKAEFNIRHESSPTDDICGGLRIKRTRIHDGISSSRDIVQDYSYDLATSAGVSSGVLFRTPKYAYRINNRTAVFSSLSMAPLTGFDGYHIGYKRVLVDKNGLGEEEFIFETEADHGSNTEYPVEPNDYKVDNGTLEEKTAFAENSQEVSRAEIFRNTSDYYEYFGNSTATGYIFAQREVPYYTGGSENETRKLYNTYYLSTNIYRPDRVVSTVDGVTSTTEYEYHDNNLLPAEVMTINSNGDEYKTINTYTTNFNYTTLRNKFIELNMVHLPYKTEKYFNGTKIDGSLVDYRFYRDDGTSPSTSTSGRLAVPRVYRQQRYEKTWNESGTLTGSGWQTASTVSKYTSDGLLHEYYDTGWSSTKIDYLNKRLWKKTFNGFVEQYSYLPNNSTFLNEVTTVDGTTTSRTYDDLGRLETVTDDCKNIVTTYEYGFGWGGQNINYIEVETDYPTPDGRSMVNKLVGKQYKDGLGRDIVSVRRNAGPNSNEDIITGMEYDKFGRVIRSYEPYARSNNYGNYRSTSSSRDHTLHSYEASPLSRKLSITPPDWHATNFSYGTNASSDQVKKDDTTSYYSPGTLMKNTIVDGNGNKLITFTDKIGQRILSRRTDGADAAAKRLDTYYLHDGKGRVKTVVPPDAVVGSTNLIYGYLYDDEDRVISRRIPGKEPINYRYNTKDLLGAYQDGNMLDGGKWYAYNYDNFGRSTTEGFYNGSIPSSFSNLSLSEILIENIYGTSSWEKDKIKTSRTKILGSNDWLETTNTWSACGLLEQQSGNNHRNLSLATPELTTYDYDGADNVTESVYNHRFPGTNRAIKAEHHYDYAGRSMRNYFQVGNGANRKINRIYYDEKGNVDVKYQGGTGLSGTRSYLQKIDYSYLSNGMLQGINTAGLSGTQMGLPGNGGTSTLPTPATPSTSNYDDKDLFYLELYRDNPASVSGPGTAPARYNGDISFVASQVRGRRQHLFGVKYDEYDRMTEAKFYERFQPDDTGFRVDSYREALSYDKRGNIETLSRKATYQSGSNYYQAEFDDLTYNYDGESNELSSINDTEGSRGYHEQAGSYTYDDNGNTTYDPSRKINIEYNHLDLPTKVKWSTNNSHQRLEMTYDATGTLLRRQKFNAGGISVERRDFIGGLEYVNNALESVAHQEGRVYFGGGSERYDYALTDHLGNIRLLYSDLNNNGIPDVPSEIVQEAHYLPFGMKMEGPWIGAGTTDGTRYGFNGIEHVDDFDLNVNMAFYRTLDPTTGRWWQVDPKAEMYHSWSPYISMGNSPMVQIDPQGDFLPLLPVVGALVGGTLNLASQALQGNVTSFGEGLSYFGVGAAAGALATTGNLGAARAVTVGGNKVVQIATGKWKPEDLTTPQGILSTGLSVAGDFGLPGLTNTIAKPLASGLASLGNSLFQTTVSGGGQLVKQAGAQAADNIAYSVGFADDIVVSASKAASSRAALPAAGQLSRLARFGGDEAVNHFGKHGKSVMDALGRSSYNLSNYIDDANHVIRNGTFVPEMNGYVKLIGGPGSAKFGFTGLNRATGNITTFHIKSAGELARKAPWLIVR